MVIASKVAQLIKTHGSCDPFRIAKEVGIYVVKSDLPKSVRGIYVNIRKRKVIMINFNLSESRQSVVAAHELGHAVLHTGFGYYSEVVDGGRIPSKREAEANEFAVRLLLHNTDYSDAKIVAVVNACRNNPPMVHAILTDLIEYI